jgi:hypothetical protein
MAGPWDDYAPPSKATSGPWDDFKAPDNKGIIAKLTDPFRQGAADLLGGEANTLKETGNGGVGSQALQSLGKMAAPENYKRAHVTLDPRTWGDIPKALAESSPGLAQDMAAGGVGATAGCGSWLCGTILWYRCRRAARRRCWGHRFLRGTQLWK